MNRTTVRLLIGLIWIIGAIVCFVKANFLTAALCLLVGVVFVVAAIRKTNTK
ncbi:hypothetical protein [Solibacillus sp. R5-41]|uniref:hypothetical protein n=1 Tax=Solibacillus sp. R5-41 TaxID=2048654 RepID=UPI0012FE0546|nr:hypothetical protein [Solibacillus sp. R5-41]